jgi:hypothetical protein
LQGRQRAVLLQSSSKSQESSMLNLCPIKLPFISDLIGRVHQVTLDLEYRSKQVSFSIFSKKKESYRKH